MPRTTKNAINKPIPQLRKRGLNSLAQTADERPTTAGLLRGHQQPFSFFCQEMGQRCTPVAAITKHNATSDGPRKRSGHITFVHLGWSREGTLHLSFARHDGMQFEAEEPARRAFAEIRL